MTAPLRILLLEDDPADAELSERTLREAGIDHEPRRVEREADFRAALADFRPDLILADYHLPDFDGKRALEIVREQGIGVPFVFVSGAMGEETAVESLHHGANDFVLKEHLKRLPDAVMRALREADAQRRFNRIQQALQESEAHFRLFYENSPTAYQSLGAEGDILDVNPAWLKMLGYRDEDKARLLGQSFARFLVPEQAPLFAERFPVFKARGEVKGVEFTLVRQDGTPLTVAVDGRIGHDLSGGFRQTHCVLHDITERKAFEQALDLQARRAEALLKLPGACDKLDEHAFMQHGQELTENLTGSTIAFIHFVHEDQDQIELVAWSRNTLENYCSANYDRHYPIRQAGIWADALRRHAPVVFNDYPACPDKHGLPEGHAALQRLISVPVIENGRVVMIAGVGNKASDYTDLDLETVQLIANEIWRLVQRCRGQKALKASQSRYHELIENMSDGVVVLRVIDDGQDFEIVEYNRASESICGVPRTQAIGHPITELFPSVREMGLLDVLRRVHQSGLAEAVNDRFYQDARLSLWLDIYIYRLPNGEIVAVYNDITERKRAAEKLERNHATQKILNALLRVSLAEAPIETLLAQAIDVILAAPFLKLMAKGGIFLIESGSLRLKAHKNLPESLLKLCDRVAFGQCLCGRAAASGEIQFAECLDARHDIRYDGIQPHGHYNIPILHAGRVTGVIVLYLEHGHARNDQETAFLQAVADTLSGLIERKRTEATLKRQTEELASRNAELERFNLAMVDRELDMIELKRKLNALSIRLGEAPPYDLSFADRPSDAEAGHD